MEHDEVSDRDGGLDTADPAGASAAAIAYAYPADLAALVLERWREASGTGHTGLTPPTPTTLVALLSICYQATLLREEGRPVSFRLAVSDPSAFDVSAGPPSGLHRLVFSRRLSLDPHELRRLSPAARFSRSLIGTTIDACGRPVIWGIIHSGPQWLQSVRGGRAREQRIPHMLTVAATGPGRLLVSIGTLMLAELRNGTASAVEMDVFESRWMHDTLAAVGRRPPKPGLPDRRHHPGRRRAIDPDVTAALAGHVVRRILSTVRAAQHGGTLILIPDHRVPDLLAEGGPLHVKYGFNDEEPRQRIGTVITSILAELTAADGADNGTAGWHSYESSRVGRIGEMDEALFEVAHLVADLTRVDGTVLMTHSLELLGFGVEITGGLPEVARVARAIDLEGAQRQWVRTDRVGTRHRSAYRLCQAVHDALVLVVSQDGGLRFIRWHADGVTYWEQRATGPSEV